MAAKLPILIVDKKGILGSLVAQKISSISLVVLVSKLVPEENLNIVHVPFSREIPTIPDNTYSHILLIDDKSSVSQDALETFLKKAEQDNSELMLATFLSFASEKLHQKLNSYKNSKIVLIGDVFDNEYILEENTPSSFVEQIRKEGKIQIKGDGMDPLFPILLEDVVDSLSKIIFEKKQENLICLFPKNPITSLSLAHLFQKQNPLIKIDFTKDEISKKVPIVPGEGYYYLGDSLELSEKIKKIDLSSKKITNRQEIIKTSYFFRKFIFTLFLIVAVLVLLPVFITVSFSAFGTRELNNAKTQLFKGNLSTAQDNSQNAFSFFKVAKYSIVILEQEAKFIGQGEKIEGFRSQIEVLCQLSQATIYFVDAAEKFDFILKTNSYSKNDFLEGANALKNSVTIFRQIETKENLPPKIQEQISEISPVLDVLDVSVDYLPQILGFEGEKRYLLLFQNNMELRPGGGFIGSYATLKIKNAKVSDFKIYDVYDADGQLKEHLEPPFPIRRYLQSAHFYLRDSNFYLNFADNALSAQNFLYLEKKEKFNGTVAIDVSLTKDILSAMGGLNVVDYDVKVTADNFFELADKYSRNNFFPGSTQKKDFLGAVFRSIEHNIADKNISYTTFVKAVTSGISQKHIQVYFNESTIQNAALLSGFSPSILDRRSTDANLINDYSGVVEANLGVNKVNKDVARSQSKSVIIDETGKISSTITLAYKNNSKRDSYKNYLRFITPLGSTLETIRINGKDQEVTDAITDPGIYEKKTFKPPHELEVLKETQSGKTVFGLLMSVPTDSIKTVSISYVLPNIFNLKASEASYSLKLLKQPGTEYYPFSFEMKFPDSLNFINSSQSLKISSGKVSYETQLEKDIDINLKLAPK